LGRLLQYALLWVAARQLGPASFGDFTFALSVGLMLSQVADFGLQLFVQRELARLAIPGAVRPPFFTDETAAGRLVGGGLAIKGVLSLTAMVLMALLLFLEPVGQKPALLLVGLSTVLGSTLEYLAYCFRALGRLRYEALANLLGRGVNLALGVGLLLLGGGVLALAVAGNAAMLLAIGFAYTRLLGFVRPVWRPDWHYWRGVRGQPAAIGIGVVFSIISFRVDNLLIPPIFGHGRASEALGFYNVAYKLFEPSQILPGVLLAATFPMLARMRRADFGFWTLRFARRQALDSGTKKEDRNPKSSPLAQNLMILLVLGLAVTFGLLLLAAPLVRLLYGTQYAESVPVLQVLALAVLPMYLNYLLTHTLIAMDRPWLFAYFTLAALVVNVGANLLLIPSQGILGAAWATVATELLLFVLCAAGVARLLRHPGAVGMEALPERSMEGLP
jgi:O-antigen/teichoic acid export membrane protein